MTNQIDDSTIVRTSVDVEVAPDRAFAVFIDGTDRWLTRAHHVQSGQLKEIGVDPHVGGRIVGGERCRRGVHVGSGVGVGSSANICLLVVDRFPRPGLGVNPRRSGQRRWLARRTAPICRRGLEAQTPRPRPALRSLTNDEREVPTASRVPPSEYLPSHRYRPVTR
jgi:hypothetical protein